MRRMFVFVGLASMLAAGSSLAFVSTPKRLPSRAPGEAGTFLIQHDDGYGVAHCLASGGECGKTVADGYCRAHGYAASLTFGPVSREDITGSVSTPSTPEPTAAMVLSITCRN
jgi:hypothetical protein